MFFFFLIIIIIIIIFYLFCISVKAVRLNSYVYTFWPHVTTPNSFLLWILFIIFIYFLLLFFLSFCESVYSLLT